MAFVADRRLGYGNGLNRRYFRPGRPGRTFAHGMVVGVIIMVMIVVVMIMIMRMVVIVRLVAMIVMAVRLVVGMGRIIGVMMLGVMRLRLI